MDLPYALDFDEQQWREWLVSVGAPAFTGKQILNWLFRQQVNDPALFTNLSQSLRERLQTSFSWALPEIDCQLSSLDGSEKLLLKTPDNLLTEAVLMPSENRVTLCISSQVGCRMGCTFCQTGKMGFKRDLSSGEILAQIIIGNRRLRERGEERQVTNIVFMGMGEPLDNYEEVVKACRVMIDPAHFGLSKHRVTISTSGLVPQIYRLARELPVRLAISLHSADDVRRSSLMPVNRQYPLAELKKALMEYPAPSRYGVTFEYVMIQGENDSIADAKKLVKFVHGIKAKVNLIPMNHFPGSTLSSSEAESIRAFQQYLSDRSIPAPVRYSRGQDVSAACGQLAAKRAGELNMSPIQLRRIRKKDEANLDVG
ncbi:MAG: 23S rRNA (adenine(2503)-C(2))-methyltransferase RlmN [Chlamydiales bacterium]|nr:23S rRNA (adenine(2503)-C(2))-methyltransferase RlmN [Chlamydiales bacterium]